MLGVPVAAIPDDLAIDGVDELLKVFVAYGVGKWGDDFTEALADSPGRSYAIVTDGAAWRVRTAPGHFDVAGGPGVTLPDGVTVPGEAAHYVTISGTPAALLRWVWNGRRLASRPSSPSRAATGGVRRVPAVRGYRDSVKCAAGLPDDVTPR